MSGWDENPSRLFSCLVTTADHKAYLEAVETAFGPDYDYAILQKIYGGPYKKKLAV